jgi:hypothetical protein
MPPEQVEGALDLVDLGFDIGAHRTSSSLGPRFDRLRRKAPHARGFTENEALTQDAALLLTLKTN